MKTSIYLVRHGEVHNPDDVWYGRLPRYKLSKKGNKEIEQTAEFLASQKIDYIYSSRQLRAVQTAKIIQRALQIQSINISMRLQEVHSVFQGKTFARARAANFDVFGGKEKNKASEKIEEVLARMQRFIKTTAARHEGNNVVAVSHGDPIMIVDAWFRGLPITNESIRPGPKKYIKHGEVFKLTYDQGAVQSCKSIFNPQV